MTSGSKAAPFDQFRWSKRVLVVVAPPDDPAGEAQRQIYQRAAKGMSERAIVLVEARDESARSRQIRASLSTDGKRFRVFLIGKDGNTAIASDKPLAADDLFGRVDAMPMRRDEMQRGR
ncbi:MAG: DUF4174 domain-containing protein [Tardiphaga sp.]